MARKQYSIYEAKARFSEIIRTVKDRRRVVITERGTPVAEVIPFREEPKQSLEERVKYLESIGALIPAKKRPRDMRHLDLKPIPGAVERFLKEDRD